MTRTPIPQDIETSVRFKSMNICCVCGVDGLNPPEITELHHINENHSDHREENLAPLCSNHQTKVHTRAGRGKLLTAGMIREYKKKWEEIVIEKRGANESVVLPEQQLRWQNYSTEDWEAQATNNVQGISYKPLLLEGNRISFLSFDIYAGGYWRAGFKIMSVSDDILPLRSPNSFLFHLGSVDIIDDSKENLEVGRWYYIGPSPPDARVLETPKDKPVKIEMSINSNNFLYCLINGELEFKERFDPSWFERAYLAAWGDGNQYIVKFSNIKYRTK